MDDGTGLLEEMDTSHRASVTTYLASLLSSVFTHGFSRCHLKFPVMLMKLTPGTSLEEWLIRALCTSKEFFLCICGPAGPMTDDLPILAILLCKSAPVVFPVNS